MFFKNGRIFDCMLMKCGGGEKKRKERRKECNDINMIASAEEEEFAFTITMPPCYLEPTRGGIIIYIHSCINACPLAITRISTRSFFILVRIVDSQTYYILPLRVHPLRVGLHPLLAGNAQQNTMARIIDCGRENR